MADINLLAGPTEPQMVALIELLFFAYRDFVSDPDEVLQDIGFGRAHHRVVHFIGRAPGMTVAQLLDILRITKQSLGRVLRDLVEKGYVYQKEGEADRRQRLLYLTDNGEDLLRRLMAPQAARIERAIAQTGFAAGDYEKALLYLVNPENRASVQDWIVAAGRGASNG